MPKRFLVEENNFGNAIARAEEVLRQGGVIAYPTETVYGLGALLSKEEAIERIRRIKGKREPILVLVSGEEMAERYVEIDERARRLIRKFWPGPLTLVLKPRRDIWQKVCAGSKGLGVRMSSDKVAQALVQQIDEALTSTSANRSGQAPLATGAEIEEKMGAELDLILDAGPRRGESSTVIELLESEPRLIREGALKWEIISKELLWRG